MTTTETIPPRPFGAVGSAIVTPLSEDGTRIDLDAAQRLAAHVVAHGNDMIVVSGTTGEAPTLSDREKLDLARAVREAVGPEVRMLAGVGTYDTAHSIELARAHAELPGVDLDGLLVVCPYYSKPSQAGLIAHVIAIAEATDLPLMLYDIPGRSAVEFTYETLVRLSEHEKVLAIKDTKANLHEATRVMAATGVAYYSGEDAMNLPWLSVGASGFVSVVGQVAGDLERELIDAVDRSDIVAARAAHRKLAPLVEAIMNHMPGAVSAKASLYLQGVLPHTAMRRPLLPADADQLRDLAAALDQATGIPALDPSRRPA